MDKDLFGPIDVGTWNGTVAAPQSTGLTISRPSVGDIERRWEAADTDRLNEAHWQPVTLNMNDVLETQISELQARCRHEAANNAVIDAGIETQQTNAVGRTGPRLQVLTESSRFNDDAEAILHGQGPAQGFHDRCRDDLTGQVLKDPLAIEARMVEPAFFHSKGVWVK